jgi:hypothetical protein
MTKKDGMSTASKIFLGVGVGLLTVAAATGVGIAAAAHSDKKKYESCGKCQQMKEMKQEEIFTAEEKKQLDKLQARNADLIKEYGACECPFKDGTLGKLRAAFNDAHDALQGWISIVMPPYWENIDQI